MSYFETSYLNRLNRYGNNYAERVLTQRREVFKRRLDKSVYRISFTWQDQIIDATFERYKQDETEIMKYLFTDYEVIIPNGTVLLLPDPIGIQNGTSTTYPEYAGTRPNTSELEGTDLRPWMVYYLEEANAKGYNRYVMLKMTHYLEWKDRNGNDRSSYAYMYGQEDNMLMDEIRSRSRMNTIYSENLKASFFVMPATEFVRKDDYFIIDKEINNKPLEEYYRVTGYDIQSQDGVEYVTVDPIYEYATDYYDDTVVESKPVIEQLPGESDKSYHDRDIQNDQEYFWLEGLMKNPNKED